MRIAVLLTCFNRQTITLRCIRHLTEQEMPDKVSLDIVLVDDGSSDGTADAVSGQFPFVQIVNGSGNLFWCGGMRVAWETAAHRDPDYYLLLNDDTELRPTAIRELLDIVPTPDLRRIAVAAIADPVTGMATYGGRRNRDKLVVPSGEMVKCETFNANCVLIPRVVFREIGNFHPAYRHAMGDYDYGYRASRSGVEIYSSREFLGTCPKNTIQGTWRDKTLPFKKRLQLMQSPKGLPWREWLTYNFRNDPLHLPWKMITPFLRIFLHQ
jgi:GT2 family glycosyltransferase